MSQRAFSGLFIAMFALSACAGSVQDGIDAWLAGDRATAIASWRPLAEQGDPEAGLFLGYAYRRGLGVLPDDAIAARWYRFAAERGQPEAQYELALMYELGLGVPQDPNEAARWYGLSSGQACPAELTAGGRLGDR
jgi:TPR repeat protein